MFILLRLPAYVEITDATLSPHRGHISSLLIYALAVPLKNCFEGCSQAVCGGGVTLPEVARAACRSFCETRDFHRCFVTENFDSLLGRLPLIPLSSSNKRCRRD